MTETPKSTDKYETRVLKLVVRPPNEPLSSERATFIEIDEEYVSDGRREFVKITQEGGHTDLKKWVSFVPDEWQAVQEAVSFMMEQCRNEDKEKHPEYPGWVCYRCGASHGKKTVGESATWHKGTCGVCGKDDHVTEPRDFGHLRDGWQKHGEQDNA